MSRPLQIYIQTLFKSIGDGKRHEKPSEKVREGETKGPKEIMSEHMLSGPAA